MSRNWNVLQAEFGDGFTMFACFYSCLLSYICVCVCARFFIPDSHYFWLLALKNLFFSLDAFVASQNVNFVVHFHRRKNVIRIADRNNETTIDSNESEMRYQRFQSAAQTLCDFWRRKKKRNKRKCWLALRFKITTNWSVNFAQNPFSSGFLPNSITIGDILILFYFKSFEVRSSRLFCL